MDSQLKEVLAAMQNEIAEMRGKNERILNENEKVLNENGRILKENGTMHGVIEKISKENERILKENDSMHGEIERILKENERVFKENERVFKENERILQENEGMHDEIEKICNENERIDKELASVRKDLEAARVQHTSDVDALREVTALLVPLHLRVLLDLARKKVLEHLGYETWEGLRASRSVLQLADTIFNDLKQKGVSYPPSFQSVFFLCSYNNIRRAGNTAAHSAKEDDIRHAVLTQALDSQDRKCLESLFTYAYNGEQV
jgi:seryl-tRNA synthetase